MKKIILLGMVLLPCMAFASTDCRVIEYPDHNEAICTGDAVQTPTLYLTAGQEQSSGQERATGQDQADASDETVAEKRKEAAQEMATNRNNLARAYGDIWLKSRQGR